MTTLSSVLVSGDLYINNKDMKIVQDAEDLLSPYKADAICYRPMAREEVDKLLVEKGLRNEGGQGSCGRKGFINNQLLDILYNGMDYFIQHAADARRAR